MTVTPNGNSYPISNTQVPNNYPCEHADLQQQIIHITIVLEQLSNRIDDVDERRARSPNRRGRGQLHEETLGENLDAEYRDVEPQHHRLQHHIKELPRHLQHHREELPRHRDRQGLEIQPIDELTKRMKVDMTDFYGKLEPHAFEDWLTTIKDHFDWFAVLEDQKVRYIMMKLNGHARVW
jgi:predicted  nucleic acid-binding Zn-ribbon protein